MLKPNGLFMMVEPWIHVDAPVFPERNCSGLCRRFETMQDVKSVFQPGNAFFTGLEDFNHQNCISDLDR